MAQTAYKKKYMKEYRKRNAANIKKYYQDNATYLKDSARTRYYDNAEDIKARAKAHYQKNADAIKARQRVYNANNPDVLKRNAIRYKMAKLNRTPAWLTDKQMQQIEDFYMNCPKGMSVDHIIPLRGKYVSGLHHPDNLQYLTKSENSMKGNRYEFE